LGGGDIEFCDLAGDDLGCGLAPFDLGGAFGGGVMSICDGAGDGLAFGGARFFGFGVGLGAGGDMSVMVMIGWSLAGLFPLSGGLGGGDMEVCVAGAAAGVACGFWVGLAFGTVGFGGGDICDRAFAGLVFGGLGGGDMVPIDLDGWCPIACGRSAEVGVRVSTDPDAASPMIATALTCAVFGESSVLKMGPFFMAKWNACLNL
jgi:hypothetical protein